MVDSEPTPRAAPAADVGDARRHPQPVWRRQAQSAQCTQQIPQQQQQHQEQAPQQQQQWQRQQRQGQQQQQQGFSQQQEHGRPQQQPPQHQRQLHVWRAAEAVAAARPSEALLRALGGVPEVRIVTLYAYMRML